MGDFLRSRRGRDGFLLLILLLLAFDLGRLVWYWEFVDAFSFTNLVLFLMLLFNHVAFQYTKTGKARAVMEQVAIVWTVLGFIYVVAALFSLG